MNPDVAIIGAGIVGLATAWALRREGKSVLIVDRAGMGEMTSRGNAGAIAVSDILPLASPGIMRKAPKWFFDPLGPLSIPVSYFPRILPWLWQFWRASLPDRFEASIKAQAELMKLTAGETEALCRELDLKSELRPNGALYLYESEAEFRRALPAWRFRDQYAIPYEHIDREELARLEPALSPRFIKATRVRQWTYVSDPYRFTTEIGARLCARGLNYIEDEILSVTPQENSVILQLRDAAPIRAANVVIAAGAWSHKLTGPLGDPLPLETERGYNTTIAYPGIEITHELIFGDHGFVAVHLDCGLRIGGADELAGLERPPDYRRSKAMLAKATRFLPELKCENGVEWMGHRPSLPDSLPVIGRSPGHPRILYAFGHGHLGLTQAAASGRLVADLVAGRGPAIDIRPFRPERFR
jgi:D-amino-acid dehydrogenase